MEYGRLAAQLLHMCQDIRVNALVGTRSPYSLPFVILPVPARSPFRLLVHRTRSTPNLPSLHRLLGALGSNPPHAGTAFGWSYRQPALKGEVANEVRRRGYKEACSSLSVSTPQSRLMPCQLPVRGAFWLCATATQKLSPFTGKVARSAERGADWRSLLALCNHPTSSPYNTPPHTPSAP